MKTKTNHLCTKALGYVVLLSLAGGLSSGCQRSEAGDVEAPGPSVHGDLVRFPGSAPVAGVSVEPVTTAPGQRLILPGRLVWNEDHTVRVYPPFSGRITRIEADLGSAVEAGQVLAVISSPDFGQAQADERKAAADMAVAQKNLERQKDLYANGVTAEKELEQAQADFARAKAGQERAQALMRVFGSSTDIVNQQFSLKSPIAGVVVERSLNPGQEVRADQPATPLFVITNPSDLWLQLDAGESEFSTLKAGQIVEFSSSLYPGELFKAEITRIADYVDPATRTVKIRGRVANPDRRLKGEMFVSATAQANAPDAPAVPAGAVYLHDNRQYLFVADGVNTYMRREVSAADEVGGQVLVRAGVKPGERVVTRGALYLQQLLAADNG